MENAGDEPSVIEQFIGWIKCNKIKSTAGAFAALIALLAGVAEISGYSVRDIYESIASRSTHTEPSPEELLTSGWGPDREVFTIASGGAPYPAYNCIVDSEYGDERNFATVRDTTLDPRSEFKDEIDVVDGHVYEIRIMVNNCGPDSDIDGKSSWVQGSRLAVVSSKGWKSKHAITVYLDGTNVTKIWDNLIFTSDEPFRLLQNRGEIHLFSNAHPIPGIELDRAIFSSYGTPLGYENMDGYIRPGYQYAMYVYIKLTARTE